MKSLKDKLYEMQTSSPVAVELLLNAFVPIQFHKGAIISMPGHQLWMLYYLESGLVGAFSHKDGTDHTFWFTDNGFILPPKGFFNISHSDIFIQVLENSFAWSLNLYRAELLAKEHPILYRMLLEIYEERLKLLYEHLDILNISNGLLRFSTYIERYKGIHLRVSNYQLASLLRINYKHLYKLKQQYYRGR